jgi:hypothetical protein
MSAESSSWNSSIASLPHTSSFSCHSVSPEGTANCLRDVVVPVAAGVDGLHMWRVTEYLEQAVKDS